MRNDVPYALMIASNWTLIRASEPGLRETDEIEVQSVRFCRLLSVSLVLLVRSVGFWRHLSVLSKSSVLSKRTSDSRQLSVSAALLVRNVGFEGCCRNQFRHKKRCDYEKSLGLWSDLSDLFTDKFMNKGQNCQTYVQTKHRIMIRQTYEIYVQTSQAYFQSNSWQKNSSRPIINRSVITPHAIQSVVWT